MDIDTSRSMSSEAAEYLRHAKSALRPLSGRLIPKSAKCFSRWSPI